LAQWTLFGEKYRYDKATNDFIRLPKNGRWMGGMVKKYSSGGLISGPGSGVSDSIVASFAQGGAIRVSNGEFIQSARAVNYYGHSKYGKTK